LDEARKPKPSIADIELLKGRLLEEQQRRERVEAELAKLKGIQARAQLASCTVLPSNNKPDGSSYADMPQRIAYSEKYACIVTISCPFVLFLLIFQMVLALYALSNLLTRQL
jgi:mitotic spindle assembly checkpoint protein MAD1